METPFYFWLLKEGSLGFVWSVRQCPASSLDPLKFAQDLQCECEFRAGLDGLVKPWLSRAEESTAASLAPPHSRQAAGQTEQACVAFAKVMLGI